MLTSSFTNGSYKNVFLRDKDTLIFKKDTDFWFSCTLFRRQLVFCWSFGTDENFVIIQCVIISHRWLRSVFHVLDARFLNTPLSQFANDNVQIFSICKDCFLNLFIQQLLGNVKAFHCVMALYNFKHSFNIFLTYVELTKLCSGRLVVPSPSLEPLAF